jgi:signal transduction histidine kinase
MATTKAHLRIDSHVVIQLGAELISDSEQALLELVKNAYDADASKCVIALEPDWKPTDTDVWKPFLDAWARRGNRAAIGRIVVADDGDGVDERGVRDGWLYISASLKRSPGGSKPPTLRKHRVPVGDKGLGRLATMRLGEVLQLRTMTAGEKCSRTVSFAWSQFSAGAALENVPVKQGTSEKLTGRSHGTNVEILGLAEPQYWATESNVNSLLSKLSYLISPFKRFKDFRVNIRSGGQDYDLQSIGSEALNFSSAKFEFQYTEGKLRLRAFIARSLFRGQAGQANRQIFDELLSDENIKRAIESIRTHPRVVGRNFKDLSKEPGGWLFSLDDEIAWTDIPREPKLPGAIDPGPFEGEIYNFLFNDQTKEQLHAANVSLDLLQGMTTVGVFRDGFRVRMSDDWMELAKGVTSGGFFQLRPRNVIGYFSITNEANPQLVEKSDREGFVDNEAWRGFMTLANRTKKFANDSLDAVRTAYDEHKKQMLRSTDSRRAVEVPLADSGAALSQHREQARTSLRTLLHRSEDLTERVADTKRRVADLRNRDAHQTVAPILEELERIQEGLDEVQEKVETASVATNSGFTLAGDLALSHEQLEERNLRLLDAAAVGLSARSLVHEINTHLTQLGRALTAINTANRTSPNDRISKAASGISDVLRELKKTVASINPLSPGSRTLKDQFDVYTSLDEFRSQRSGRLNSEGVEFILSGDQGLRISFSRARFTQILENLLQNSLYWIGEHAPEIAGNPKKISVIVDENGFSWSDSAKGVRKSVENSIFEAYVSDKPESKGQGLGLFIVSSYLQAERCSIALLHERNRFQRRYVFRVDLSGAKRR